MFSYYAKLQNKSVHYNDVLRFNSIIAKAIIDNSENLLTEKDVVNLTLPSINKKYKSIIADNFSGVYYTDLENNQIDVIVQNIHQINNESEKASAYYLLFQSCLIKRPYNLFHRNNLSMRTNYSGGKFGNKITWERSFEELFQRFNSELNKFCFRSNQEITISNSSALELNAVSDLVYIDPPYFPLSGSHTSYHSKYHFLEGLSNYYDIPNEIKTEKKNNEIQIGKNVQFESRHNFLTELGILFDLHSNSIIVMSYRNNGFPSIESIANLLKQFKDNVQIIDLGNYGYALNKNNLHNSEVLIVGF